MDKVAEFLTLETELLVVVAFGYLGFSVAYAERVSEKNNVRVIFLSACFALIAGLSADAIAATQLPAWLIIPASLAITLSSALVWRLWGMNWYSSFWGKIKSTDIDGLDTALDTIRLDTKFRPSQLVVHLRDGSALFCENLATFKDLPLGPCIIGKDGSISLFATHHRTPQAEAWNECDGVQADSGNLLTFVPADQVRLAEFRV